MWPAASPPAGAVRRRHCSLRSPPGSESPGFQAAFDEAFLEMAAQGQSTFVATGDCRRLPGQRRPPDHRPLHRLPGRQPLYHRGRGYHPALVGHRYRTGRQRHGRCPRPADLGLGLPMARHCHRHGGARSDGGAGGHRRRHRWLQRPRAQTFIPAGRKRDQFLQRRPLPDAHRLPGGRRAVATDSSGTSMGAPRSSTASARAGPSRTCRQMPTRKQAFSSMRPRSRASASPRSKAVTVVPALSPPTWPARRR